VIIEIFYSHIHNYNSKRSQWKLVRMTDGIQKNHIVNLAKPACRCSRR